MNLNLLVLIIELFALVVLFSTTIILLLNKNPENMVDSYPQEIQDEYYKTHARKKQAVTKGAIVRKSIFLIVCLFVFAMMSHFAGAKTCFWKSF